MPSDKNHKILFLGDSYTVGTGLESASQEAYPFQLLKQLTEHGYTFAPPKLYAIDGHTTENLIGLLDFTEPRSNPDLQYQGPCSDYDIVFLSIGINDLFRGHHSKHYQEQFAQLVERAIKFANNQPSHVIVLSIPDWDTSPCVFEKWGLKYRADKYQQVRDNLTKNSRYNTRQGVAETIDEFNLLAKEASAKLNVNFIDLTSKIRSTALVYNNDICSPHPSFFAKDSIHFSPIMHKCWADWICPKAESVLLKINSSSSLTNDVEAENSKNKPNF